MIEIHELIIKGKLEYINIYYSEDEEKELLNKFDGFLMYIGNSKSGYKIMSLRMSNVTDKYRNHYVIKINEKEKDINKSRMMEKDLYNSVIELAKQKGIDRKWSNPEFKKMYVIKINGYLIIYATVKCFKQYIENNKSSTEELEKYKIYFEDNKKGNTGKLNFVDIQLRKINNKGTKSGNGTDETIRLKLIRDEINMKTEWGIKFRKDYYEFYEKEIDRVELKNTNKSHYDLLFIHIDGTSVKCEEKGNKELYDLYKSNTPWEKAVQRLNGKPDDFIICKLFARIWYDKTICNDDINNLIGNNIPPPSFEEWYDKDCKPMANPKTLWGINNKKLIKGKWLNNKKKISLNGKNGVPIDGRDIIHEDFIDKFNNINININNYCGILFTNTKQLLKCQIQKELDNIMEEKDIWITTCGPIINLKYRFWKKINSETILDIDLIHSKGSDFIIKCITKKREKNFECYLRWGKGCGLSNIRFDIR